MAKPKVRPPSQVDHLTFPVFGITWHGAPSSPNNNDGCSVIAYCGGGGSAKTGVGNKIVVTVTADCNDDNSGGNNSSPSGDVDPAAAAHQSSSSSPPTSVTRRIVISTGEALCFGVHAFRPYDDPLNMVRLLACVGDEILMYGIPLRRVENGEGESGNDGNAAGEAEEKEKEQAILLARTNVGKGYGANVAAYSACHVPPKPGSPGHGELAHFVAVGCENGTLVNYRLNQTRDDDDRKFEFERVAECRGHSKAVCALRFHPRGTQLLSSAKDGTARVFDARSGSELCVMKCEVHDPSGPPPVVPDPAKMKTKDPRMMRRAPQVLVRGCFYGDLEGRVVYTVASGKRGPAYLTEWRAADGAVSSRGRGEPVDATGAPPPGGPPRPRTTTLSFDKKYRIQCSPVPVSATSLSADGALLALGSVEGSVSLYDLESKTARKQFSEVHDLPVTCIASRPVPSQLMMPGELEGGVNFDAVSASADNRLGRYTLQKRSRVAERRAPRSARKRGAAEEFLWRSLRVPLLSLFLLAIVAVRDTMHVCKEEIGLSALVADSGASAGRCIYREVLWAEESRVSFVPE